VPIDLLAVRQQVAAIVCSSSWLEVCWDAVCCGGDAAVRDPEWFLRRHTVYPPGGVSRRRGMRRCTSCGRWCPRPYLATEERVCQDCVATLGIEVETDERTHVSTTSSPSAIAIRRMEALRVQLVAARLAPEGEAALVREIATFRHTGRLPLAPEYYKKTHL
jgi:hypothetical protein